MKRRKGLERRTELRPDPEKVREFMRRSKRGPYTPKAEGKWIVCARAGCGKTVYRRASELRKGTRYCSRECWRTDPDREPRDMTKVLEVGRSRVGEANPNYRHGKRVGKHSREGARRFKSGQRRCVHPDCNAPLTRAHEHHVVYEQHVRREGGDIYDPRNALRLCAACHMSHHRRGSRIVPLSALRDENYEFAFELLGPAAFDYLRRRYRGDDARLHAWLARATAAVNSGSSEDGGS